MKFCGKCGNALDISKKFCSKCGAPNLFFSSGNGVPQSPEITETTVNDFEKQRIEKERIISELAKKEEEKRQAQLHLEQQRVLKEQLEREAAEKKRLDQIKKEQEINERIERERIEALLQKQRDEELARQLYEQEKLNTLDQIKQEREKLKQDLEEIQKLKEQISQIPAPVPSSQKGKGKKILGWIIFLVVLVIASGAGYYLYLIYLGKNDFQSAQDAISRREWSAAAGYLSKSLQEYKDGTLSISADDVTSAQKWILITQQLAVELPKIRSKLTTDISPVDYKLTIGKFNALNIDQLSQTPLQKSDVVGAAKGVTLLLDSFRLAAFQGFLNNKDKLRKENNVIIYTGTTPPLNIDTELASITNKFDPAIAPAYEKLTELKALVLTQLSDPLIEKPQMGTTSQSNRVIHIVREESRFKPANQEIPKTHQRDAD